MGKDFKGIYAALLTPYDRDGQVNEKELKKLVRYLIRKGIDGFYVAGSTGETFLLSLDERKRILETVLEENNGEKIVLAHVGHISTEFARECAVHAKQAGADAVSAISPFYYKFSVEEIRQYYFDIMDASDMPMFIYNFPNMSGFSLTSELLDDFCRNGNLAGVKFTSNDFFQMERMKKAHPDLTILNGFDEMLCSGLAAGADGGVGSTYNILAPVIRNIYEAFRRGDMETARANQAKVNELISITKKYGTFKCLKAILEMEGIIMGDCRKPFLPLVDEAREDMKYLYERYVK